MLFLPQALPLLLAGRIPPNNAAGSSVGPGIAQGASQNPSGAQAGNQTPGSPQSVSVPNPVPAPPGAIQPSEFYVLDESNPNARYTGVQLREGMTRATQYDALQGEYHRTQNALRQEQQARQAVEAERDQMRQDLRIQNSLQQMGVQPQAQQSLQPNQPSVQSQPPVQQSLGQQPGGQVAGGRAGDDWLASFAMNDASQSTPGIGQQPAQQPVPPTVQPTGTPTASYDPRDMALMMQALIKEQLDQTLTPLTQQLPQLVDNAVGQRFNQQARQDGVRQSFQAGREQLSNSLRDKYGITEERSRDILDKWALSSANYEEASNLMNAQWPDAQQQAQAEQIASQKIAQGNMFFNSALEDGMSAAQEGQQLRMQQEAQNMLLTGDYVDLGEMDQPNMNVWSPQNIAHENQRNLSKAMEVADMQGRLQAVAGPVGGPIQPSGFMQPGYIQPLGNQPTGYVPPLHNPEPMWGNQQPTQPPAPQMQPQQPPVAPQQPPVAQQGPMQQVVTPQGQMVNMPQWGAYQQGGVAA